MSKLEIRDFSDALSRGAGTKHVLLGNGFSRAWNDKLFSYRALFDSADFNGLSRHVHGAFEVLDTTDFEVVMQALRDSARLVKHYSGGRLPRLERRLRADARKLREVLVKAIAGNHPERPSAVSEDEYTRARAFLQNFRHIYTLNYDLLLYWTMMQQQLPPDLRCDDGFRTPDEGPTDYVTWDVDKTNDQNIHYLHGALHIFDGGAEIQKYTWVNTGVPLMNQVRRALSKDLFPIFVSEGSSRSKLTKIQHQGILNRSYRSLANITGVLYVYGHSMGKSDAHIHRLLARGRLRNLFVGLYGDPDSQSNRKIRKRCDDLRRGRRQGNPLTVEWFDSESARVWR